MITMTNPIRNLINIIQEASINLEDSKKPIIPKQIPWTSAQNAVALARRFSKVEPQAVRFSNTGQHWPDTRVWAQEWDGDRDPLLGAVEYGASRGRPKYWTLEPNIENPDIVYIDIYY